MASINLTIPDGDIDRVLDSICKRFGYRDTIATDEGSAPNPETKLQFVHGLLSKWIRSQVIKCEQQSDRDTREQEIADEVNAITIE